MAGKNETEGLVCIMCPEARFLDPGKEICYKTGGLYCRRLKAVVGKYDPCRALPARRKGAGAKKKSG